MAHRKIRRQAVTHKGFVRRVHDMGFEQVHDPRLASHVTHHLEGLLGLSVLALASGARSTRDFERRTLQLDPALQAALELDGHIADNTLGTLLPRLPVYELRRCLHRHIKAEWRRKRLRPDRQRFGLSSVAIDGKHLATIPEWHLRALVSKFTPQQGDEMSIKQLRYALGSLFPHVQLQHHEDEGVVCGLVRVHRATLTSARAAVVIDQLPISGDTNEIGTILSTLRGLLDAYARSSMVELVSLDAGNSSSAVAELLVDHDVDYLMRLKSGSQKRLHERAIELLAERDARQAQWSRSEDARGKRECVTMWTHRLEEQPGQWKGARRLVRVERVVAGDEPEDVRVGTRYFVTSTSRDQLEAEQLYEQLRAYWRCENEGHWTADAIWEEDRRRTPWTKHPVGVEVVGLLRVMAINIQAILRASSRVRSKGELVLPTWREVIEHALLVMCRPVLEAGEFHAFED